MTNEIILYSTPDCDKKAGVLHQDEGFWMTQEAIAELPGAEVPAVSKRLDNMRDSGEPERATTVLTLGTAFRETGV